MSSCRDCGETVLWATDERGSRISLSPQCPVYAVVALDPGSRDRAVKRADVDGTVLYVPHRATCSRRKESNGRGQRERPDYRARAAEPGEQEIGPGPGPKGTGDAR